ncbi:MAG: response regulator [Candidatus Sumerlaeaceae bacterium]|nr:response regulator [Candidatus Sumerlaeaceae bacterium]
MRILLAEDDPVNRLIVERMLRRAGHEVICAANGQEAVDKASREGFDLILMDCEMPVLDGCEAARLIREQEGVGCRTLILALTAHAGDSDRELFLASGMDGVIAKPFDMGHFERLLRSLHTCDSANAEC